MTNLDHLGAQGGGGVSALLSCTVHMCPGLPLSGQLPLQPLHLSLQSLVLALRAAYWAGGTLGCGRWQ